MTTTFPIALPAEYGYVILAYVLSSFVNFWHGMRVGGARKVHGVQYPAEYQITLKDGKVDQSNVFNCFQRSHQNFLENYFMVMGMMFIAGFKYPVYAAAAGTIWLVGRVMYALGYQTGDPKKRMRGGIAYVGLLGLLVMNVITALSMLGYVKL